METERLIIKPLDINQLDLWINDLPQLEKLLNCKYDAEPIEGIFKEIISGQLEIAKKDMINCMWYTFWLIIRKSDKVVVGAADFKAPPASDGVVEIGYGLGKEYEKNGYMTETVKAMCDWAFKQNGVKKIVAETDLDGIKSQNILLKCGFREKSRAETKWYEKTI